MPGDHRTRVLNVEGLANARDLGGLPRADESRTPTGQFFRSDNLHAVTAVGWGELRNAGIRTVIDLRQPGERERLGYQPPPGVTVQPFDHDGLDDHPGFWGPYWDTGLVGTGLYYAAHVNELPERSAAVLRLMATAPDGGVLFHCAGGRDRTGIISALLLTLAGVQQEAIVGDYMMSVANGAAVAAANGRPDAEPICEAICREHGTTTEGAFRTALRDIDVRPVMNSLADDERARIATWRGSLS